MSDRRPQLLFVTATRIGDCVMSLGLLDHLIALHPGAEVTVAVGLPSWTLFSGVPGLKRIIRVAKRKDDLHWPLLWSKVVGHFWTVAVDLRGSILPYLVPTRRRISVGVVSPDQHRVEQLGAAAGLATPPSPKLWLPEHNVAAAQTLVGGSKPLLALSPAAGWRVKEWPVERFADIAMRLTGPSGPLAGGSTVVLAGENERDKAMALLDLLPPSQRIGVVGEPDLLTIGAILAQSSLFIGNDSGLAHLAGASGCPTLALFGPTSATVYRPWGPRATFVQTAIPYGELLATFQRTRDNQVSLMDSLSVDAVEAATHRLLGT